MRNQPLPHELRHFGHLQYLQYRGNDEWSAECVNCGTSNHDPNTGEPDRMRLFGKANKPGVNPRVWCRSCGYFSWADADIEDRSSPSPEAIAAAKAERERLERQELERTKAKLRAIQASEFWKQWHDQMEKDHRELWHQQGIIDYCIDYYQLGYYTTYTYHHNGQEWRSPAMTIPHWQEDHVTNIQFRLTEPQPGAGKYRQMAGLPAAMFLTEPGDDLTGAVLIVEGAKKAIVTYTHLGRNFLGMDFHIVGIPSKTPSTLMLEQLVDADPIYLALDPDAYEPTRTPHGLQLPAAASVGEKLGDRVRYVHFPAKPDDLIVKYGLKGNDLLKYLKRATVSV